MNDAISGVRGNRLRGHGREATEGRLHSVRFGTVELDTILGTRPGIFTSCGCVLTGLQLFLSDRVLIDHS